jgi:molybdate transport system substrate-binding protein
LRRLALVNRLVRCVSARVAVFCCVLVASAAGAAEVKVICANAMMQVLGAVSGEFERATGHKLLITYGPAGAIRNRIAANEVADVAIVPTPILDQLTSLAAVLPGSRVDVAKVGIGLAVRSGAPRPDISSPEALKTTLLAARSISHGDLVSGGVSGPHFMKVLERLGIAAQVDSRRMVATGLAVAKRVADGESEIAINQISELVGVDGVELVGPLPDELQNTTSFSAGVLANGKEPEAARALLEFLVGPAAIRAIRATGMEPLR